MNMKDSVEYKIYNFLRLFNSQDRGEFVRQENGSLIWKMNVRDVNNQIKNAFKTLCKTSLDKHVHLKINPELEESNHLIIDLQLNINARIYIDLEHFKRDLIGDGDHTVFERTFIFKENIFQDSLQDPNPQLKIFYDRHANLKKILEVFAENSHHHEDSQDYMIYIDPNSDQGSGNVKLSKKISLLRDYPELLDEDISFTALKNLQRNQDINEKIAQNSNPTEATYCSREKAILRNTIVSFISQLNTDNKHNQENASSATYELLTKHADFDDKFDANLQVYLKDISIDKIKSELTQEQVKLFESINKSLQEVTNRLMIIPGLGALAALIRYQTKDTSSYKTYPLIGIQDPSMILFLAALIITSLVVLISINNQRNTVDIFESMYKISKDNVSRLNGKSATNITELLDKTGSFITSTNNTLLCYEFSLLIIPPIFLYFIGNSCLSASYILVYGFLDILLSDLFKKKEKSIIKRITTYVKAIFNKNPDSKSPPPTP